MKTYTFLAFIVGAAVGSVCTWLIVRKAYNDYVDEELGIKKDDDTGIISEDSYGKTPEQMHKTEKETSEELGIDAKMALKSYNSGKILSGIEENGDMKKKKLTMDNAGNVHEFDYSDISKKGKNGTSEEDLGPKNDISEEKKEPYFIDDDEFNDPDYRDYGKVYLTYYADGVLADADTDEVYEDLEDSVGLDFNKYLEHSDVAHFRNERKEIDYEVVNDVSTYAEMAGDDETDDDETDSWYDAND